MVIMKRIVSLILMLALTFDGFAHDVTPEEAKTIAAGFLLTHHSSGNGRRAIRKRIDNEKLTVCDASKMVYAVSYDNNGFVLVSKDDAVSQILGYCDEGAFDYSQMPDAFKEMMTGYDQEIALVAEQTLNGNLASPRKITRKAITPLITSKWNQGESSENGNVFNWQCPTKFSGLNTYHCVTGCVATAMAQVMYFWKYPQTTQCAIPAYSSNSVSYESLPVTSFDWENMRDEYLDSDLTDLTSNLAEPIGKLMKYCGYAAKMNYGVSSSGASVQDMFSAMISYFGYNENAKLANRQYYSIDAWNNMLYEELQQGRPVLYSGSSTGGGHQFILDGVDSSGLFHVNWGWGGRYDGYYVINLLNPKTNSTAGASSTQDGYSMDHWAVIGLQPETTSTMKRLTVASLQKYESFLQIGVLNFTNDIIHCGVGAGAIADDGNVTPINGYQPNDLSPNTGLSKTLFFRDIASTLGDGTFRISGIYSIDGTNWYECEGAERIYAMITVEGGSVTNCIAYPTTCDITVSDGLLTGNGYVNVPQEVEVTFQNLMDSEYSGVVGLYLSDGSSLATVSGLYLKANSADKAYFYFTPTSIGLHTLYLYEVDPESRNTIRKLGEITVNITYGPDGELEATLSIPGAVDQGGVNYVNSTTAKLDININNNTNTADYGYVLLKHVESNAWLRAWRLGVSAHMSQTLTYQLEGLVEGTTYTYEAYYNTSASTAGAQFLSSYTFVVGKNSIIEKESQTLSISSIPTMTYGAAAYTLPTETDQGLPITWISDNNSVAIVSGNTLTVKGAGTATITATQAGNEVYNQFMRQFPLTVNKAEQNIALDTIPTLTYGSDSSYPLPTTTVQNLTITWASDNNSVATVSGNVLTVKGVGTATITATQAGDNNYNPLNQPFTLTVVKRKANQTIDGVSKIELEYGVKPGKSLIDKTDQGLPITLTCSDSLVAIIIDCKIWVKGAGTATITATQAGNDDYYPFTKSIKLIVKQAPLTITAINESKKYGHENPTLTVSYSGFLYDDDASALTTLPQITTTADKNSSVGTYPISVSGAIAPNYSITYKSGVLTVNKATLTITADDKTKTEGEANPELTVSYDGFMNGETASVLTRQPSVTTTATNNSPVGNYPITVTGAAAKNYNITYVSGTLTIVEGSTPGDVNGDGEINGFDIVLMVDVIMGDTSVTYDISATDLDGDGEINGFDLVELVDLILSQPVYGVKARKAHEKISTELDSPMLMSRNYDGLISVGVDLDNSYILSQFVLELSDGQRLIDITSSDPHHVVAYRQIDELRYIVLCYSTCNTIFSNNRDMLTIKCEGDGNLRISDVMLIDSNKKLIKVGGAELNETTCVEIVNGFFAKPCDIYSISGTLMRKNANSLNGLEKGVYIIDGKTVFVK